MRILHVLPTYLPAMRYGGPIVAVHGLCEALVARGHFVEVFTTNVDGAGVSPVAIGPRVAVDGVQVRYFSSPALRRLYWAPDLGRALKRYICDFDVVHLHSVFLWPTWAAARAARDAGVPYVLSPRGMLVQDLIARRSRWLKTSWIRLIEKKNLRNAAAIHLTSQVEALELERFGWNLPRLSIIPNGVSEPLKRDGTPAADIVSITAGQPYALFFGRLSWKKGLDRLLRAFARTASGTLAIVGTDDENLTPDLLRLAQELQLERRVRIISRTVLGQDKESLFASARVFVLASYSENFGNTVLEAMRRGVPVIATPEVGAAEIVQEAGGGLVVAGDAESFGAAMEKVFQDRDLSHAMGNAGRSYAISRYSWARVAADMESLYSTISQSRGKRRA